MQKLHGVLLIGGAFAFLGQLAKRNPKVPNELAIAVMAAIGALFYAGNYGWPHADAPTFQSWFGAIADWLESASIAIAAIPGAASMIGMIPGMQTQPRIAPTKP